MFFLFDMATVGKKMHEGRAVHDVAIGTKVVKAGDSLVDCGKMAAARIE